MGFQQVTLTSIGLLVFLIGTVLMIAGIISIIARRRPNKKEEDESKNKDGSGEVRGGGAIIIGPFPIVFGTDRRFLLLAVLAAIALMIVYLLIMLSS